MTASLSFQDVSFGYGDGPDVVENVTLEIGPQELIGLIGPNGGGKSTLLKLAAGLLRPRRGMVQVFGRAPHEARDEIGYVPQFALFPRQFPITVAQAVLLGRLGGGFGLRWSAADRKAAARAIEETELGALAERPLSALSGGELQRVLIARALAAEPHLLLLDEPTSNLDQRAEEDIFALLARLTNRMAVVLVSHDVGFVTGFVQRVACISRTLICHGTSELTGEVINELYGHPVRAVHHAHHHHSAPPGDA
ncbi:MAG TPA: ATP-binding cassette domain-containing protein [Gammaproteobacteria bacterium]|nr:ATP-binding cassette domain-containing protein [Gammaproteobacteria bacterium]